MSSPTMQEAASSPIALDIPVSPASILSIDVSAASEDELPWWSRAMMALRSPRFQDELLRTVPAVMVLLFSVMATAVATALNDAWFHENAAKILPGPDGSPAQMPAFATHPLYDHVAAYLPNWVAYKIAVDAGLNMFTLVSLIITLGFPIKTRIRFQSLIVLRRFLWILAFLYGFRVITFLVTAVPSTTPNCVPKYLQGTTGYRRILKALNAATSCTDNIYSGHTSMATATFFLNFTYSGRFWFILLSAPIAGAIILGIVASKMHYTIDVVVALFMTSFVWCLYHFLLMVYIDQEVLRGLKVNKVSLKDTGGDPAIVGERRLLNRFVHQGFLWALRWIDGMDIRTSFARTRHYGRNLEPTKV